jgi:hypothetical protein
MASQTAQFDLSTAFLDMPKTIAYGLVRGAGNLILQQELTDKTRVSFYMLGEGRWDSIVRLWINNKLITLPSSTTVHFHPGGDGEIGNGLTANSTGGDQHVDQFFTLLPGGLDPITFSRYAWLALKTAPDPGAPSAQLTVLADYQAMQVRQFDSSGNQTSFAWTQNPAWWICDFLIRKFVLREGKINQPLVAAEVARFDWASFSAAATYYDAVLSGGQKRFSDGGVVFLNDSDTADRALEQLLLMCRSYLLERNGKLSLYADQARSSVFTFTSDNVAPLSSRIVPSANVASSAGGRLAFKGRKSNLRAATNRLVATCRDLNIASGSTDDATRFAISTLKLDHEAHQRTVGARGPGLSVLPKVTELALDLGVNTPERVWRILKGMLVRQLGDDVDANTAYNAPFSADWTGYEDSLAVENGDVVTIDKSLSEEFGGKLVEVLQIEEVPDGTRNFTGLEYMPNAFPDAAPAQQGLQAPIPGTGLPVPAGGAHFSYRPTTNPLTGHDAGSNATVPVAAFVNRVGGVLDISVSSGSITALSYATLYWIYYDDPGMVGGAQTFQATTVKETAINGAGRFFIGSIVTPAAGANDTVGNNDGGTGAQFGQVGKLFATAFAGNYLGVTTASGTGGDSDVLHTPASEDWKTFGAGTFAPTGLVLYVISGCSKIGTGSVTATLQYSTDNGSTFTTFLTVTGSRANQLDTVALPAGTDFNKVVLRGTVKWNGGAATSFSQGIVNLWLQAQG